MRKAPTPSTANGAFQNQPHSDSIKAACFLGNPETKATATVIACLALAGHVVHKGQGGDFTVCKYGLSRYCKDSAELRDFAKKLGVAE